MRCLLIVALIFCIALFGCAALTVAHIIIQQQVHYVPCRSSCGVYYPTVVPYATPTAHVQHHR